jgi:predicted transcriptional regulator
MTAKHSKIIKIGIMPLEDFKRRTIAIAKGYYKPKKSDPKIWFHSIKSLAYVLSENNQKLLTLITDTQPKSIKELETVTGRKANNLLRTLRMMENYGFIKLSEGEKKRGRTPLVPEVLYDMVDVEINFAHGGVYN